MRSRYLALALAIGTAFLPLGGRAGSWTGLVNPAPDDINTMLLLSDGTVMCANGENSWYRLTPDNNGSYVNGAWSSLASMNDTRLYYASQVLTNGGVFVAGGEYGTGTSSAEVYNPVLDAWMFCPGSGQNFEDNISDTVPGGNVLVAPVSPKPPGSTIIYNVASNSWIGGPSLYRGTDQDEASWVKLPDNSIITIDPFGTDSERYIPSLNQWVNDADVPVSLYDPYGDELGPAFLLPNGTAIFFGSLPHTAIYTPSGNNSPGTWARGPDYPNNQGMPDAPGAMMVDGHILLATSPTPTFADHYPMPTSFYEYDPVSNLFAAVPAPEGLDTNDLVAFGCRMLDLPDGMVLFSTSGTQLYVYQPSGPPLLAGQPAISSISTNYYGSYHLTGTLLNGISEGANYGDDAQMNTDYPLVRMTNGMNGNVYYARTYNWSSTSVMTGSATNTTEFTVPPNLPAGMYSLVVTANGNSSTPVPFAWTPDALQIAPVTGFAATGPTNGPFYPASEIYTLSNTGASSLNWAATNTSLWLTVSPSNGVISAGQFSNIVVSLSSNAASLALGTYSDTVSFANLNSGAVQAIPYRLQVTPVLQNGGFETGSLGFWTYSGDPNYHRPVSTSLANIHSGLYGASFGNTNLPLYLSQTVPTLPEQTYLLSFWLANEVASGTNEFQVSWNGTNLLDQTNLPTFNYTNLQFIVLATSSNTVLQFGFLNDTAYFGLDDVSLNTSPSPPIITMQPANEVLGPGGMATFSVGCAGTAPFTYSWLRNATPIAGANAASYSTNNVQTSDSESQFSCVVSNALGSAVSSNAILTVTSQPVITMQPINQTVFPGRTAVFSVSAGGAEPFAYTWMRNAVPVAGANAATYTTNNTQISDSGSQFSCLVSNAFGSVVSSNATLTVLSQLVQNGGFETGSLSSWTQSGNTNFTDVASGDTNIVLSGQYGAVLGPSGSLGYLSQSLPTLPGQNYLLSLWLDSPDGQTPNEFLVSWNGSTLFDQTNLAGVGWTNLIFSVAATASNTFLELGFRDDPSYLALDDVSVTPWPAFQSVAVTGGSITFTWNALVGSQYQVQYKTNLNQSNWMNLGSPVTASNSIANASEAITFDTNRFYRVGLIP